MTRFNEFIDRKTREAQRQLKLLKQVLERNELQVKDFLDEDEPYLFVRNPNKASFDGIRIYKKLDVISFRIQKEEATHPYGKAYLLDVEEMYADRIADGEGEKKAATEVMRMVAEEIKEFFAKSAEAEKDIRTAQFDDPYSKVTIKSTGTDYSNLVHSKGHTTAF